jgi:hypothetical protein
MAVKNGINAQSIHDEDAEDNHSLNHSVALNPRIHPRSKRDDRMGDISRWRKHAFNVILPRQLSEHSESDLKLMRVSLKNAISASSVHLLRIERELKKRGSNLTILG